MRPKLGIIGKWRFCYSERIFRVGRVARNVENACFSHFRGQCIRSRNASHLCAKPFGTYRNVWSWNGFDDIKQHATERRNRFDQAVTASGATMQAGPDHWRRPRRPARRGRIPLSENALAQTGAGTATVVLLTAIMALIDVGVYDICRVDSGAAETIRTKAFRRGAYSCMPECIGVADDSPRRLDGMEPWMCAAARRGIVHWNRSYGWRHHEGLAGRTGYGT